MLYQYGRELALQAFFLFCVKKKKNQDIRQIADDILGEYIPIFPLNGQHLKHLGVSQGPEIGDILNQVEAWWVKHDFMMDEQACLEYAQTLIS